MREAPCPIPQIIRQLYRAPRPAERCRESHPRGNSSCAYDDASAAGDYAKQNSRSHGAVIRVFNEAGRVIETHKHAGDFKEASASVATTPEFYLKLVRLMLQNRARIVLR